MTSSVTTAMDVPPCPASDQLTTGTTESCDKGDELFLKPFDFGFTRELVLRATRDGCKKSADAYYYKDGHKMRSKPDVISYLKKNMDLPLTGDNFTFCKRSIHVPPHEVVRQAKLGAVLTRTSPSASPEKLKRIGVVEGKRRQRSQCRLCLESSPSCAQHVVTKRPKLQVLIKRVSNSDLVKALEPDITLTSYDTADTTFKKALGKTSTPPSDREFTLKDRPRVTYSKIKPAKPEPPKTGKSSTLQEGSDVAAAKPTTTVQSRTGASGELCNIHCPLAAGQLPTLQCLQCLCHFHPVCVQAFGGVPLTGKCFTCRACQKGSPAASKSTVGLPSPKHGVKDVPSPTVPKSPRLSVPLPKIQLREPQKALHASRKTYIKVRTVATSSSGTSVVSSNNSTLQTSQQRFIEVRAPNTAVAMLLSVINKIKDEGTVAGIPGTMVVTSPMPYSAAGADAQVVVQSTAVQNNSQNPSGTSHLGSLSSAMSTALCLQPRPVVQRKPDPSSSLNGVSDSESTMTNKGAKHVTASGTFFPEKVHTSEEPLDPAHDDGADNFDDQDSSSDEGRLMIDESAHCQSPIVKASSLQSKGSSVPIRRSPPSSVSTPPSKATTRDVLSRCTQTTTSGDSNKVLHTPMTSAVGHPETLEANLGKSPPVCSPVTWGGDPGNSDQQYTHHFMAELHSYARDNVCTENGNLLPGDNSAATDVGQTVKLPNEAEPWSRNHAKNSQSASETGPSPTKSPRTAVPKVCKVNGSSPLSNSEATFQAEDKSSGTGFPPDSKTPSEPLLRNCAQDSKAKEPLLQNQEPTDKSTKHRNWRRGKIYAVLPGNRVVNLRKETRLAIIVKHTGGNDGTVSHSVTMERITSACKALNHVFRFLSVPSICRAAQVCTTWNTLAQQKHLWEEVNLVGIAVKDWDSCTNTLRRMWTHTLVVEGNTWQSLAAHVQRLNAVHTLRVQDAAVSDVPVWANLFQHLTSFSASVHNPVRKKNPAEVSLEGFGRLSGLQDLALYSKQGMRLLRPVLYPGFPFCGIRRLSLTTVVDGCPVECFLSSMTLLQELQYGSCSSWTLKSFQAMSELSQLRQLTLIDGGRAWGLSPALRKLKGLKKLQLKKWTFTENLGECLEGLPELAELHLAPDNASTDAESNLNALLSCISLKSLQRFSWTVLYHANVSTAIRQGKDDKEIQRLLCPLVNFVQIPFKRLQCSCPLSASPSSQCCPPKERLVSVLGSPDRKISPMELADGLCRTLSSTDVVVRVNFPP